MATMGTGAGAGAADGTMTTTEPRQPHRKTGATPVNLRLYLAAALAVLYVAVFFAIGTPESPPSVEPRPIERRAAEEAPVVIWIGDLPAGDRPALHIPPGWDLDDDLAPDGRPPRIAPVGPALRQPLRVVPSRPRRIRTRSS